ncbi:MULTISPECIES: hypothetical protein [Pasteurellaceae]|uniref:Uncharacterized protein n=3 Tax=Pasteurellaceae TaxID=712 RepID=A0A4R2NBJ8_9PAST|nr:MULTISPECIES: hypothetical protein [Pasteurellaceae]HDR1022206.1 hypothetical protein [Pasteurella multocida]HJF75040.1 hypothetical protein [Gallibacterium anatis]MCW9716050.1 hypothetical protein [Avibacterium sp. 21-594]QIR12577.1 hypothetical protein HBL79_10350 [Avibacterium paragallinarum]QLD65698.1 hypothetical protein VY92_010455 [Avibacterium paragallinarum]
MNWPLFVILGLSTLFIGTFVGLLYWANWDLIKAEFSEDEALADKDPENKSN